MDIPFELLDEDDDNKYCNGTKYVQPGTKDIQVQLVISLALGVSAFLVFCVSNREFAMSFLPVVAISC